MFTVFRHCLRMAALIPGLLAVSATALAAPANDNFASAQVLTGTSGNTTGTNVAATGESGENPAVKTGASPINSVWYTWTASADMWMQFDTIGSGFDTVLEVYTGNAVNALTVVNGDDDSGGNLTSLVKFFARAGVTYRIVVDGFGSATGIFPLHWLQVAPLNDGYVSAIFITDGLTSGTLQLATNDGNSAADSAATPDVWYRYNVTQTGTLYVATCGTRHAYGLDTIISVHPAGALGTSANQLAANDDYAYGSASTVCSGTPSSDRDSGLALAVTSGQSLLIRVTKYSGLDAPFRLLVGMDSDGDGVPGFNDAFPANPAETTDTDRDGIGNNADSDDDNDTIPDVFDQAPGRDPRVADWAVKAGGHHNCALDDTGVRCWGANYYGETTVPALSNPVAVSAGNSHTCALDDTGVHCWGYNNNGQTTVPALSNPVAVSAGYYHTCALDDTGVHCWGSNSDGQRTVPALSNPVAVSAGRYHTCALDDTGVHCWGSNSDGQRTVPALSNPVAVSAGGFHTCALDATGAHCWGYSSDGQTTVPALSNPVAVSTGVFHTCALDATGVHCWGWNASGQTAVPALINPVAVSAGDEHTCALDDTGVHCWGLNDYGQSTVPALAFDKDRDGLGDGLEDANHNGVVDAGETDARNADSDGDGLDDGVEDANHNRVVDAGETNPLNPDSDGDGAVDGAEDTNGNGMVDAGESNPLNPDSDGDGLTDGYELNVGGSDPTVPNNVYTETNAPLNCDYNDNGKLDAGDVLRLQQDVLNPAP